MKRGKASHEGGERTLPLLPLHPHVLLPSGILTVAVRGDSPLIKHLVQLQGREAMVAAVPYSLDAGDVRVPEEGTGESEPHLDHDRLFHTGTAARVVQILKNSKSGLWTLSLEGQSRLRLGDVTTSDHGHGLYFARVTQLDHFSGSPTRGRESGGSSSAEEGGEEEEEELAARLLVQARRLSLALQGPSRGAESARRISSQLRAGGHERLADVLGSLAARTRPDRLALLGTVGLAQRLRLVSVMLERVLETLESGARSGVGTGAVVAAPRMPGSGPPPLRPVDEEGEERGAEVVQVMARLAAARPPATVLAAAQREARRLGRGSDQSPGYAMGLTYLETLADLPWDSWSWQLADRRQGKGVEERGARKEVAVGEGEGGGAAPTPPPPPHDLPPPPPPSLQSVRAALDSAHSGLDGVKSRIVQHVAVQRLRGWDARAPILCLVGPPGVGKTSLAASVASCLGRPFHRVSLGGVRDEAEVRGHRRTYVGALPGRVLAGLRAARARDAVLLLDEVDKMGRDARGDPAAALLEVLDPEQNAGFVDAYLALPFDLSSVMFIATANRASDIPGPLLDRMEVIHLPGYTLEEKMDIATRHLVPRVLAEHGLTPADLSFPEATLRLVAEGYTREAGVRALSRALAAICRHVAVDLVAAEERKEQGLVLGGAEDGEGVPPGHRTLGNGADGAGVGPVPAQRATVSDAAGGLSPRPPGTSAAGSRVISTPGASPSSPAPLGQRAQQDRRGRGPPARDDGRGDDGGRGLDLSACILPAAGPDLAALAGALSGGPLPAAVVAAAAAAAAGAQRSPSAGPLGWLGRLATGWRDGAPDGAPSAAAGGHEPGLSGGAAAAGASPPLRRACEAHRHAHAVEGEEGSRTLATPHESRRRLRGPLARAAPSVAIEVTPELVESVLRAQRYDGGVDAAERVTEPGTAAGLVWTSAGGAVQYIECIAVGRGRAGRGGQLTLTGQLGDVLEESARIALSWVRAHAAPLGCGAGADGRQDGDGPAATWDVHVHLPAGAVPKDGPSAGVTLAVALASLFTGRPVRADVAMTGELTLRGLVLPVGGVKEKLLAAHAAGIKRCLVPARVLRDAKADLPPAVLEAMEVIGCTRVEEVFAAAFDPPFALPVPGPRM